MSSQFVFKPSEVYKYRGIDAEMHIILTLNETWKSFYQRIKREGVNMANYTCVMPEALKNEDLKNKDNGIYA